LEEQAVVEVLLGVFVQEEQLPMVVEQVLEQLLTQQQTQEQLILVVEAEVVIGVVPEMVALV
jgi:hypothetical protein